MMLREKAAKRLRDEGVGGGGAATGAPAAPEHPAFAPHFQEELYVGVRGGEVRVLHSAPREEGGAYLVLLHGGGLAAMSWALLAGEVTPAAPHSEPPLLIVPCRSRGAPVSG